MGTHYDVIVIGGGAPGLGVGARVGGGLGDLRQAHHRAEPVLGHADGGGYLALLSDGERLTGAHALAAEAGEWLQQATLAIRARLPLDVLRDTIQPFPTFSEIYLAALKALDREIAVAQRVARVAS